MLLHFLPLKRHRFMLLQLHVSPFLLRPYSSTTSSLSSSSSSSSSMPHVKHCETSSDKVKQVELNRGDENSTGKHEPCVTRRPRLNVDGISKVWKHLGLNNNQQRRNASATAKNNADSSVDVSPVTNNNTSIIDMSEQARTPTSDVSVSCSRTPECPTVSSGCNSPKEGTQEENESAFGVDYTRILEENSLPTSFGKRWPSRSKRLKSVNHSRTSDFSARKADPKNKRCASVEVFDICQCEVNESMILRSPIVFSDVADDPEVDSLSEGPSQQVLRPGMILLKKYITFSEQVSIVKKCRKLGIGKGGFYQPGYKDGAKLRLHMMCLGHDWDPQTRKYSLRRRIDKSMPPGIPPEFCSLVCRAMLDSYDLIERESQDLTVSVEDILPWMNPDICIVNFYSETGRLGLHQDRDESPESLAKGLPVVSVSLGDSAEFLYGNHRDANKAKRLTLESGDVLIFGGESRHVFHGVASIIPNSAPPFLLQQTRLRPGRLNLTFRKF